MEIFIDTALIEEIREVNKLGILDGVTTNPTLLSKTNKPWKEAVKEILKEVPDKPVSLEVVSTDFENMVKEARELAKLGDNVVVKIPCTTDGLKAVKVLSAEGIRTNVTLVFSPLQALLSAKAGATYVSPFVGRVDDIAYDGIKVVEEIVEIFRLYEIETRIIAASIRHINHVKECALIGVDIVTIPYKVIMQMYKHPLTNIGIERFIEDAKKANITIL